MNIKLLVCYHKKAELLKDEIFTPIHVGRDLSKNIVSEETFSWLTENMIGDNTGDNISIKNGSYNEMTSLYWAWKNYGELGNPDYIGLMHYRRHFILREGEIDVFQFDEMDEHYFEKINYSVFNMENLVKDCDFIAHIGKVNNVYLHYIENHRKEDIDLVFDILFEKYPEYRGIAEEYFAGNESNFCNMFIFSKKIFFEYCEWIFDVLEEFEKRVNTSGKRFFVSERLTGVFIYKMMKDISLKYKVVPISFVNETVEVPIFISYQKDYEFSFAVTLLSIIRNKKKNSKYKICVVGNQELDNFTKEKIECLKKKDDNIAFEFIILDVERELYPFYVSELVSSINKCIYIEENAIVLKDLTEFFRTCSVDDFYVMGTPEKNYDVLEKKKYIDTSFLVINCKKMRDSSLLKTAISRNIESGNAKNIFNQILENQTNYIPWYFITIAESDLEQRLFDKLKTRSSYQEDAIWKPIMFYGNNFPWNNPQGLYSNFWWDIAKDVPVSFSFAKFNLFFLEDTIRRGQKEINLIASSDWKEPCKEETENFVYIEENAEQNCNKSEEWRNYSFLKKLKFYYDHNGLYKTINYGLYKMFGRNR